MSQTDIEAEAYGYVEIRRTWELVQIDSAILLELRAFHYSEKKRTVVKHFWAKDYASVEALKTAFENLALSLNAEGFNIYILLNPLRSDFCGFAAKDSDIQSRELLLIDIDRIGDKTNPATAEEISKAMELAESLLTALALGGWPKPLKMLSGNGVHLYYRLDEIENTERTRDLIKITLIGLARRFDTPEVGIDKAVYNASRITKVPGTIMRKGEASANRPYRMARVLS